MKPWGILKTTFLHAVGLPKNTNFLKKLVGMNQYSLSVSMTNEETKEFHWDWENDK